MRMTIPLDKTTGVIVYNPQSKHANVVGVKLVAVDSGNNLVQVCDKQGKVAVAVSSTDVGNAMGITNSQGKSTILLLSSDELKNSVRIYDPQGDKEAIRLISNEGINAVSLLDQQEEIAVGLHSAKGADLEKLGNGVLVVDKTRKITNTGGLNMSTNWPTQQRETGLAISEDTKVLIVSGVSENMIAAYRRATRPLKAWFNGQGLTDALLATYINPSC